MITKKPRHENEGYYDLTVTDKDDKSFTMTVGGNLDLYWFPENYKKNKVFNISKEDEFTFVMLRALYSSSRMLLVVIASSGVISSAEQDDITKTDRTAKIKSLVFISGFFKN